MPEQTGCREQATDVADGIGAQPRNLELLDQQLRVVLADALSARFSDQRSRPVVMLGMGGSLHAAAVVAHVLREAGCPALCLSASESLPALHDGIYVGVSHSGRSRETVTALRGMSQHHTVAVTAEPSSPLAAAASLSLPASVLPDTSVSTLGFTGTVLALTRLAEHIYGLSLAPAWHSVSQAARGALDDCGTCARRWARDCLASASHIDCVGAGAFSPIAAAAALMIREAAQIPAAAFETRQYLHGPMESVSARTGAVLFGSGPELQLADDLRGFGARAVVIRTGPIAPPDPAVAAAELALVLTPTVAPFEAILMAFAAQAIAVELAWLKNLPVTGMRRRQPDTRITAP
jgi:glutamine---fructose-6-phosphate transaminase (isomerizing)